MWPEGHFFLDNIQPVGLYAGAGGDRSNMTFTGRAGTSDPARETAVRPDYSFVKNRPTWMDYFGVLCDSADTDPDLPNHCRAVPVREPKLPYIAHVRRTNTTAVPPTAVNQSVWTVFHGHRGAGTKFFLCCNKVKLVSCKLMFHDSPPLSRP